MKKRTKAILCLSAPLVLCLAMTLLIGCGKGRQGETKTINILMETVPDTDCVVKNLDKFTELTGIKVNVESINYSAMHEKLLTQLLSGKNTYDVIVVDCYWVGEFVQAGWLENLDPYIQKSGFDISQYVPSMMDMVGKVNGVTYMLPFYNYMLSLIYRTDVLNDPGLKAAYRQKFGKDMVIPDNMDDYVALCKFITAQKGEQMTGAVMMGLRPDPITMEWLNYLFSCGGDFYDSNGNIIINNNAAVHALELYVDNMNNAAPKGAAGFGFDEAFNVFAQGTAATDVTYNWMMQKLNNKDESLVAGLVEITPMPGGVSLNAGWGWGIPFNAPDKETSWKFLQWVESFDIAKARVLAGGSPTRADVMRDAGVLAMYPHLTTVQKIMETSKSIPVISDAPQLIEVLGRELSGAVTGTKSAKSALDVVAAEMAAMK